MNTITSNAVHRPPGYHSHHAVYAVANRSVPIRGSAEWQVRSIEKIARLSALRPNWDSYGSVPVAHDVIDAAIDLVASARVDAVPIPRVVPLSDGGIHFEWDCGSRSLEIEIQGDFTVDLLTSIDDEPVDSQAGGRIDDLLFWLMAA